MDKAKIKKILQEVLTDLEIKVYLASLEGSLTIQELAKKANLNRSGTYRIVESLIHKGLLSKELKQHGTKIIAEHPRKVVQLLGNQQRKLRRKELAFEELLPEVLSEYNVGKEKPKVRFYEGKKGMEQAYNLMLEECQNMKVQALCGDLDNTFQVFDEDFWKDWNKKFSDKKNFAQVIVNDSASAKKFKKDDVKLNRQTKLVKNFNLKTEINIFNDKILLISVKDNLGILIESKIIFDSYRILFETVWEK